MQLALRIIKEKDTLLYNSIIDSNRFIFAFENNLVRSFTTGSILGGIFLSSASHNSLLYYLEEIIHQGSHNEFDICLKNLDLYFLIDSLTPMSDLSGRESDHRVLFDALHGLYTVAKRADFFAKLLKANSFTKQEQHEYLGRFFFLEFRWKTEIESLDIESILAPMGLKLYYKLMTMCEEGFTKLHAQHPNLKFNMKINTSDFNYSYFANNNHL